MNSNDWVPTNPILHRIEKDHTTATGPIISTECPHCGSLGAFIQIPNANDVVYKKHEKKSQGQGASRDCQYFFGTRLCPNPKCLGLISVIQREKELMWIAPAQLIRFRAESIAPKVAESLKEAVACHAGGSFVAATIMVRRTLELLCEDKKATGNDLKEKIGNLAKHMILSPTLIAAADHLRILGNDAAHVDAKLYSGIGKPHAEAAIDLAKRILEAVYQHDDLIDQLKALATPTTDQPE